jgi:hypothetical protein
MNKFTNNKMGVQKQQKNRKLYINSFHFMLLSVIMDDRVCCKRCLISSCGFRHFKSHQIDERVQNRLNVQNLW